MASHTLKRPRCYGCRTRPARKGMRFCTQRCAAEWAEYLAAGNDDGWCPVCRDWMPEDNDTCVSCNNDLTYPGRQHHE